MRHHRRIFVALTTLSLAATTFAHVFWVQPAAFRAKAGDILKIQLHVGDTFPGEIVPRNDAKIEKFVVVGPSADVEKSAVGRDADPIAAVYRSTEPGTYLIAYRSKSTPVTLEAEKFEAYLKEKGLEKIISKRSESKQSGVAARELFSRSAKAVIRIGDKPSDGPATKDMGFRVEIIPKSDPSSLKPGDRLSLVTRSDGKPYSNALVQARNASHPELGISARTDEQGRVAFKIPHSGVWVIDTVDMFPAAAGVEADWESVWASLAFEVAAITASDGK
jgi:uncharacterized GH25 family protein